MIRQVRDTARYSPMKVDEEQMADHAGKLEASAWNWVPRSLLVRATTYRRYSSYVDLTRELWPRVGQKNKRRERASVCVDSHIQSIVLVVVVVVVFTLKTVLTSIQYPSLSYSSRQRNEFPWSQDNPK